MLFCISLQLWTWHDRGDYKFYQAWQRYYTTWQVCSLSPVWCTSQTLRLNLKDSLWMVFTFYSALEIQRSTADQHKLTRLIAPHVQPLWATRLYFVSFPQVLGVNPADHVTVAALWSLRMPRRLHSWEQPARRPSSGLGITVLTTSHTAQLYSSTGCSLAVTYHFAVRQSK